MEGIAGFYTVQKRQDEGGSRQNIAYRYTAKRMRLQDCLKKVKSRLIKKVCSGRCNQ